MIENQSAESSTSNLILACLITGIYDVNRSTTLQEDDFELVRAWADSMAKAGVKGILFHNGFSEETCRKYTNTYLSFVKINPDPRFNPNVFRYLVYLDYLEKLANPPANLDAVPDAVPRIEPFAPSNGKPYVVFGKTYTPDMSGGPYRVQGRASWYGKKFHGNSTANGERLGFARIRKGAEL